MVNWAQTIGPKTARLFERILADKPHPEMGYRGCLGIIRLAEQYSPARMEAAAERVLEPVRNSAISVGFGRSHSARWRIGSVGFLLT